MGYWQDWTALILDPETKSNRVPSGEQVNLNVIPPPSLVLIVYECNLLIHLVLQSSHCCTLQPTVIVPHAHWEPYGRGSLPLHSLVPDSANPHYVSDPHGGIIVALDSSEP
jgi:hypothetical protein